MKPLKTWTDGVPVEYSAMEQLKDTASLPIIYKHIAVMPDVHFGRGSTVGSVIPTKNAIIPAAVGVDIGCGMSALRTSLSSFDLPTSLKDLRNDIEDTVPVGFASHTEVPKSSENIWYSLLKRDYENIERKNPKFAPKKSAAFQLGTLGGGNHFIELCLDENDSVWIMLHSGSRNIGNRIGTYFIAQAKEEMEKLGVNVPNKDLSYLNEGTEHFNDYVEAVDWAQRYALVNRDMMMEQILKVLVHNFKNFAITSKAVNCHHNYVQKEEHFGEKIWLTRKGAVSAKKGELGIIPGSMGAKSFIVRGKGNEESFHSCSHGAGRVMSRGEAKRTFTIEDHELATKGVECRKDFGVIDETPAAYKNIDDVMRAQEDLVEIVHTLKQIMCVKG